jgi:hypothetical protein
MEAPVSREVVPDNGSAPDLPGHHGDGGEEEEKEEEEKDQDRSPQYPGSSEMHTKEFSSIRFYPFYAMDSGLKARRRR